MIITGCEGCEIGADIISSFLFLSCFYTFGLPMFIELKRIPGD